MAELVFMNADDEGKLEEYTPNYLRTKGIYDVVPLIASIIDAKAEAAIHKWKTQGPEAERVAKVFDSFIGNGKQNFKQILYNTCKTFLTCGDAFLETIYDGMEITNIVMLNPTNVKIKIRNGQITGYGEVDGSATWKKEQIIHFPWNPIGSMCHGTSEIERMNDLLLAKNQIEDDCRRIYESYVKPINIVSLNTDDQDEIDRFKQEWAKLKNIPKSDIIVPKDYVEIQRASVPQYSTLLPDPWRDYLNKQIIMSSRMPEVALGEGSQANSEATARIQWMGHRTGIRWIQKFIEDVIERQLIPQITTAQTKLKLEMTGENPEDKFMRMMEAFKIISASEDLKTERGAILRKIVMELGLWDKQQT